MASISEAPAIVAGGKGAIAPCSWTPEESQVESCEHQDNANIHYQPFPESVSEEHEIYTDYDGRHRHHVEHHDYLSAHFSLILALQSSSKHTLDWTLWWGTQ